MNKRIALDCDGVLLDYLSCYKKLYEDLFNTTLVSINPKSYSAEKQFGIDWINKDIEQDNFYKYFNEHGWTMMKALPGAKNATKALKEAGYDIYIVTSIPKDKANDRAFNLEKEGIIFDEVIACGSHSTSNGNNIKKPYLDKIKPSYFADDLISNFHGVSQDMNCVFIDWSCENNDKYIHKDSIDIFSTHEYLLDFTNNHI